MDHLSTTKEKSPIISTVRVCEKMLKNMDKWDRRFLELAQLISTWSKDPSTQVGAVITDPDNRVVSVGYNGLPKGIKDTDERLYNRELKYKLIVHAERNALLFSSTSLNGCTIYTYPFMPCSICTGLIFQKGISRIVSISNDNERWQEDFKLTTELCHEANIELKIFEK